MDTLMNVCTKYPGNTAISMLCGNQNVKRKNESGKGTFSEQNMDTPDAVFQYVRLKSPETARLSKKRAKKVAKFPEKHSENLLIFSCTSLII